MQNIYQQDLSQDEKTIKQNKAYDRIKKQLENNNTFSTDFYLGLQEYFKLIGEDYNKDCLIEAINFGYEPIENSIINQIEILKNNSTYSQKRLKF